jgi:hypothetical protein
MMKPIVTGSVYHGLYSENLHVKCRKQVSIFKVLSTLVDGGRYCRLTTFVKRPRYKDESGARKALRLVGSMGHLLMIHGIG